MRILVISIGFVATTWHRPAPANRPRGEHIHKLAGGRVFHSETSAYIGYQEAVSSIQRPGEIGQQTGRGDEGGGAREAHRARIQGGAVCYLWSDTDVCNMACRWTFLRMGIVMWV